jgi:mRNA interferase MazF
MVTSKYPRRGDIHCIDLDPTPGAEMEKTRPCLVVTNLPTKFPLYVEILSLGKASQAVIDQIRVVDKGWIGKRMGRVTDAEMEQIVAAMTMLLEMESTDAADWHGDWGGMGERRNTDRTGLTDKSR